jgi:hypothetical protein
VVAPGFDGAAGRDIEKIFLHLFVKTWCHTGDNRGLKSAQGRKATQESHHVEIKVLENVRCLAQKTRRLCGPRGEPFRTLYTMN